MLNKNTAFDIKNHNRNLIYRLLLQEENLSQKEIANKLELSLPTVTQNLNALKEENLLYEQGCYQSTGGRKAKRIVPNLTARVALGLDITKNHISLVIVNLGGEILESIRVRSVFHDDPAFYSQIADMINSTMMKHAIDPKTVLGLGISLPAIIDSDHQSITYSKLIPGIPTGRTLYDHMEPYLKFPFSFTNDATSGGFAELWYRPATKNIFYLLVSGSVGGAIYINNESYPGENNRCAEIGHVTLVPGGKPCYCGNQGCVDAYCATGLLADFVQGTLDDFFTQLKDGIPSVKQRWEEYLGDLAVTVNNVRMLFDCDIIIGGYIGNYIEPYVEDLQKLVQKRDIFSKEIDYVKPCKLHAESSAVGVALKYIDEFRKSV